MNPSFLVLLAEDEPLVAIALQDALEEAGFATLHAMTGEDAIGALDANHSEYSGLITDIRLGGSVDGWAVASRARELRSDVPVVYISGDSAHEHLARGVPGSIMLRKPFTAAQLINAVSTLCNPAPRQQVV